MKIWALINDVCAKYWKEFIQSRKEKHWKENLFFVPIILALLAILVVLIWNFLSPEL